MIKTAGAGSVGGELTFDLGGMSSRPTLGAEITKKK